MHRAELTESFHGDGDVRGEGLESLVSRGNEMLTVAIKGGRLTFLTRTEESDDDAIKASRFVSGELEMENGNIFHFWLSDEGRGAITETAVYAPHRPQTG